MSNIIPLFPMAINVSLKKNTQNVKKDQVPVPPSKLPQYLAQRQNGVFYFKRKVPTAMVEAFGNQAQIWKSLETTDIGLASRLLVKEIAAFELRVATVRLRMVSEGISIAPASNVIALSEEMIPAVIQRYYVHMLERDDQELRAMYPLQLWFASTILAGRRQLSWPVKRGVFNPFFSSVVAAA